jgi:hypothetical protein
MQIVKYDDKYKQEWNELILNSKNGTFLLLRDYMDYHRSRYRDCSLLFLEKGKLQGCLPANFTDNTVCSHGGLTYGGLIAHPEVNYIQVEEMLDTALEYYKDTFLTRKFIYKPIPYIYHTYPAQEDLYWLFRKNAHTVARAISSTIDLQKPLELSTLRKRHATRAQNNGITVRESKDANDWNAFWIILSTVLLKYHDCKPVHSIDEIKLLKSHFPDNIKLITALYDRKIVAGCVTYLTKEVIHVQYIASNDIGRDLGALDLLFQTMIKASECKSYHYLDFGISTEHEGTYLNNGLLFQKEGFGGRAICYDQYEIDL